MVSKYAMLRVTFNNEGKIFYNELKFNVDQYFKEHNLKERAIENFT
jgi:hypothetical protein